MITLLTGEGWYHHNVYPGNICFSFAPKGQFDFHVSKLEKMRASNLAPRFDLEIDS